MWQMDVFGCDAGSGICRLFEAWRVMGAFTRAYARVFILPPLRGLHLIIHISLTRFVMLSEECASRSEGHPQPKHPYLPPAPCRGTTLLPDPPSAD